MNDLTAPRRYLLLPTRPTQSRSIRTAHPADEGADRWAEELGTSSPSRLPFLYYKLMLTGTCVWVRLGMQYNQLIILIVCQGC